LPFFTGVALTIGVKAEYVVPVLAITIDIDRTGTITAVVFVQKPFDHSIETVEMF
jgi:hypothetical protein